MTLVYLGIGWLLGLFWASLCPLNASVWLILGTLPLTAAILQRKQRPFWRPFLALAFSFLGAANASSHLPHTELASFNRKGWGTGFGYVVSEPQSTGTDVYLIVAVEKFHLEGEEVKPITGRVQLQTTRFPEYHYGERLLFSGRLGPVPENNYGLYLKDHNVYSIMKQPQITRLSGNAGSTLRRILYAIKANTQTALFGALSQPESGLLSGILLGNDYLIPDSLMEAFNATGATHIIAISGSNITVLVTLVFTWLGRFVPRRSAAIMTLLVITAYTIMVGGDAAVVRAAIMGGLVVLGRVIGRKPFGLASLMAAAIAMTIPNPFLIRDAGFQLSFVATLGMMLFGGQQIGNALGGNRNQQKQVERSGSLRRIGGLIGDWVILNFAAQLMTIPLISYHFGRVSIVSFLTNALILPLQQILMILGFITATASVNYLPLGQVLAWLDFPFLWWTIFVVEKAATYPHASISFEMNGLMLGGLYGAILIIPFIAKQIGGIWSSLKTVPVRLVFYAGGTIALASLFAAVSLIASMPDGKLHVWFLDVGEGEAILMKTPSGRVALIDGGEDSSILQAHLGRKLSPWQRSIDLIFATHPDNEHVGALADIIKHYKIGALLTSGCETKLSCWNEMVRLTNQSSQLVTLTRGQYVDFGDGVTVHVLHPGREGLDDLDENSMVVRLCYENASFLLVGDINEKIETALIDAGVPLSSIVLKASDGGDQQGTSQQFLEAVNPWVVVLSTGLGNRHHHPATRVLDRINTLGRPIARTDEMGTIHFSTDGERLWVETEK